MTIKKRLAQSNIAMLVIPLLTAAMLLASVVLTDLYLTRSLFRHISRPLDILTAGVAVPERRQRGNEQVPVDDPGTGGQCAGGGRVPHRAGRAPAAEEGGVTMRFITHLHGFCMALADSVPGVSGGTVAFILGFYDRFINALHDLFGRNSAARKTALLYLLKLGAGWIVGMALCAALVVSLTMLRASSGLLTVDMTHLRLLDAAYLFLAGAVAIPVAAVIAFSRLYLFVHYPSDILAGALLGMAIGLAAYRIGMRRR